MNVPLPFRLAVGAIAVGVDRLRTLPADLPALSVSLVGQAVRASMRVQQEITHLAARGEEVLSPLTNPPEEHPAWARFDDEEDETDTDAAGFRGAVIDAGAAGSRRAVVDAGAAGSGDAVVDDAEADVARDGVEGDVAAPAFMPDYDQLRVTQVQSRLKELSREPVTALLEYERRGQARAAFLTTLENRLTTLRSESERRTGTAS